MQHNPFSTKKVEYVLSFEAIYFLEVENKAESCIVVISWTIMTLTSLDLPMVIRVELIDSQEEHHVLETYWELAHIDHLQVRYEAHLDPFMVSIFEQHAFNISEGLAQEFLDIVAQSIIKPGDILLLKSADQLLAQALELEIEINF